MGIGLLVTIPCAQIMPSYTARISNGLSCSIHAPWELISSPCYLVFAAKMSRRLRVSRNWIHVIEPDTLDRLLFSENLLFLCKIFREKKQSHAKVRIIIPKSQLVLYFIKLKFLIWLDFLDSCKCNVLCPKVIETDRLAQGLLMGNRTQQ